MEWKIIKTNSDGTEIFVTIEAVLSSEEYRVFKQNNQKQPEPKKKSKPIKLKKKLKPIKLKKKTRAKPGEKNLTAEQIKRKEANARYRAKKQTTKETAAADGEPSQEKQDRLVALDKGIKKIQKEQEKIFGRERP